MTRVLLIEDDDDNAFMLEQRLRRRGYIVERAADAGAAQHRVAVSRPDVVLLDWHLPDMDGAVLLQRLRAAPGPYLPVVVVSAHVIDDQPQRVLEEGADAFIPKPLDFSRLLDTLQVLTSASSARGDDPP